MHPQPIDFRFYRDSGKFLLLLGLVGKRFLTVTCRIQFQDCVEKLIVSVFTANSFHVF